MPIIGLTVDTVEKTMAIDAVVVKANRRYYMLVGGVNIRRVLLQKIVFSADMPKPQITFLDMKKNAHTVPYDSPNIFVAVADAKVVALGNRSAALDAEIAKEAALSGV